MKTITSLVHTTVNAGRWLVNAGLMAVGLPPLATPVTDSMVLPMERVAPHPGHIGVDRYDWIDGDWIDGAMARPTLINPSTGLPMLDGSGVDVAGYVLGEEPDVFNMPCHAHLD